MTNFIDQFSDKFSLDSTDTKYILSSMNNECTALSSDDRLDYIELFLAIALNAKVRGLTNDPRYKKLKLLINNNSKRAVDVGNRWMDGQLSFETMLAII